MRGARDVLDREFREIHGVASAGDGIDRGGTGGSEAAAERIDADYEVTAGVEREIRPDHFLPPAWTRVLLGGRGMGRWRQSREQQNGVVTLRVELAPALVGDARRVQCATAVEPERIGQRHAGSAAHGALQASAAATTRALLRVPGPTHLRCLRRVRWTGSARPYRAAWPGARFLAALLVPD